MFVELLILSLLFNGLQHSRGTTGLQRAGALIKEPLNSHKHIRRSRIQIKKLVFTDV